MEVMTPQHKTKQIGLAELIGEQNIEIGKPLSATGALIRKIEFETGRVADWYEWTNPARCYSSEKIGLTVIADYHTWQLIKIDAYRTVVKLSGEVNTELHWPRSEWTKWLEHSWKIGRLFYWQTDNSVDGSIDYHTQQNPNPEMFGIDAGGNV